MKNLYGYFRINPHQHTSDYENLANEVSQKVTNFFVNKNFGTNDKIKGFEFNIYIENEVNFDRYCDIFYTNVKYVALSLNLAKEAFDTSNKDDKIKILLNSVLVLFKYFNEKVSKPKDFFSEKLLKDYILFLLENNLLLKQEEVKNLIIKPFETFKIHFGNTKTVEGNESLFQYDVIDLQAFINNSIAGKTFGESVREFHFNYITLSFTRQFTNHFLSHPTNTISYSTKHQRLFVSKYFDIDFLKELNKSAQFDFLSTQILDSINDIKELPRKPKDFNNELFYNTIKQLLEKYKEK